MKGDRARFSDLEFNETIFWNKVETAAITQCWRWRGGTIRGGYGHVAVKRRGRATARLAHRLMYLLAHGEIPAGTEIDHLCRNPNCVNPLHLEAVSHRENMLRGFNWMADRAAATHCVNGHPFDEGNTIHRPNNRRGCRTCQRSAEARWRARRKVT